MTLRLQGVAGGATLEPWIGISDPCEANNLPRFASPDGTGCSA
jgi:hypothetical protein